MNIHGLKNNKKKAREMLTKEIKKPFKQRNDEKIRKIEMGINNLNSKIKTKKKEKKKK